MTWNEARAEKRSNPTDSVGQHQKLANDAGGSLGTCQQVPTGAIVVLIDGQSEDRFVDMWGPGL